MPDNVVKAASAGELSTIQKDFQVYTKVPIEEAWGNAGKAPLKTRWVDVNKGDDNNSEIRSRFVAAE